MRGLRIVHNTNISSFEDLLNISGYVIINHRNIQMLAVEFYKALYNLTSPLTKELFQIKKTKYDLCKGSTLISRNVKTVYCGTESISYLAPKIWKLIPKEIKNSDSLYSFKSKIKLWIPHECPCKIYKIYVPNLCEIIFNDMLFCHNTFVDFN